MEEILPLLLEIAYIIIGLQFLYTAYCVAKDKTHPLRFGTSLFWGILGIIFIGGSLIPSFVTGGFVVLIAILTLFKQVKIGKLPTFDEKKAEESSQQLGFTLLFPVLALAVVAFLVAKFYPALGSVSLAIAALVATGLFLLLTPANPKEVLAETNRMVQLTSTSSILPQLLASLGAIFTLAGVGTVISNVISGFVPEGSRFFGVVAYVLGMVIFTAIMGNAFAAFTVITAGIGVPFVFALGANPIIASAFAMTAGYCGTLLTPMAANFNALPVALLDMKDKNGVIKAQAPIAFVMIIAHILLMYLLAF